MNKLHAFAAAFLAALAEWALLLLQWLSVIVYTVRPLLVYGVVVVLAAMVLKLILFGEL